ncbi:MAG TPA: hypothetical protein PLD73_03270 [Candidatus Hydrogenedentes bacterium]|jgi:hypothetical protein|nr:hypothetical protein [Candidatus Hydrogenedentota bacterium]HPJ99318.1 hypothetical protein [Candidatus Hydrogenedentota bacterium]
MTDHSIAARLADCFQRQLALFERMAEAHASLPGDPESREWAELLRIQTEFSRDLAALEQEFQILKREWNRAPDAEPDARSQLRELAEAARHKAGEIARASAANAEQVAEMMRNAREQLAEIQKGKRILRNLRAGEQDGADYIDRKA